MLRDQLISLRDSAGLTNAQWSEKSGVPMPTISRYLKDDSNPLYYQIDALVQAAGGSISITFPNEQEQQCPSVPAPVSPNPNSYIPRSIYDDVCAKFDSTIARLEQWLRFSVTLNVIIVGAVMALLFIDILNPTIGWFRRTAASLITWRRNV